jgi:uncharacterized metal-binding protein YceD (DUF177 family)
MEKLKIYIDRLKNSQTLEIDETLPPDFLEIDEEELTFEEPVRLHGEAYLANDHLVLHLNIETSAYLPCSICNDSVHTPIAIKNIYLTEPLEEIKGSIFDMTEEVRETVLLQTPLFTECHNGKCPDREVLNKFLKPGENDKPGTDNVHFPFSDLR